MPTNRPKHTLPIVISRPIDFDRLRKVIAQLLGIGQRKPVKVRKS